MRLNYQQEQAVKYQKGPLLIIAGAGTGKTTVITERIKWLITKQGLSPSQILALTFTEKAAKEMEERVDRALPLGYAQLWISTFHSFCGQILREEAVHIGLNPNFKLMTEAETILFLRRHLFKFNLHYFRPLSNPNKFLGGITNHFSRLRDEDINPQQYRQFVQKQAETISCPEDKLEQEKLVELARAFSFYQKLKEKEGNFDFADLIFYTLKLFRDRPNVLQEYKKKFAFILVDEFQDTNIAQYELIKLLAPPKENPNLTVTGDDSQSIYKFRGAAVSNILTFREDYKNAKMVVLTDNYRSTQIILNHSYQLIKHNNPDTLEAKLNVSKNLKSTRKIKGWPIKLILANRVEDEADLVAQEIKKLTDHQSPITDHYQYKDIAILVRANNHSEPFARALARHGIPYQFLGPGRLFHQPEIKNLIAYLRLLIDPQDDIAFFRAASIPTFKISARTLALLRSFAKRNNLSLFEATENQAKNSQAEDSKLKMGKFVKMVHRHLKLLPKETGGQILYYFLEDSGILKSLLQPKTESDQQKALNIAKFFDKIKSFETNNEENSAFHLLDWIALRSELGESPLAAETDWTAVDAVNILTAHSAKGLEFPIVFIVNLVNQRFPSINRREQIPIPQPLIKELLPEGDPHEQEERRLFYVAMTRAKDRLYFSAAKFYGEGKREKRFSPFIAEALGAKKLKKTISCSPKTETSLLSWQKPKEVKPVLITNPPVTYLSFSQVDSFQICPRQYQYKYILKTPTLPSPAQTVGEIIHRTLKEFYRLQITSKNILAEKRLLAILNQNWSSAGFRSKPHEKAVKKEAQKMLKKFYQEEIVQAKRFNIAALEQPFSFRITPKLKIGGKIDRVDSLANNEIEIIDYKTGGRIPNQKAVDHNDQLTLYALAASSISEFSFNRPVNKILLTLYFLKDGIKLSSRRTKEQIEEFKKKLIEIAEEIERSPFPPKPGKPFPCNFCEYELLCDAAK